MVNSPCTSLLHVQDLSIGPAPSANVPTCGCHIAIHQEAVQWYYTFPWEILNMAFPGKRSANDDLFPLHFVGLQEGTRLEQAWKRSCSERRLLLCGGTQRRSSCTDNPRCPWVYLGMEYVQPHLWIFLNFMLVVHAGLPLPLYEISWDLKAI